MDIPDSPPPLHHANASGTAFQNPWAVKSLVASKQILSQFPLALARRVGEFRDSIKEVQVVKPDFGKGSADEGVIKATWVGHAVRGMNLDVCCLTWSLCHSAGIPRPVAKGRVLRACTDTL